MRRQDFIHEYYGIRYQRDRSKTDTHCALPSNDCINDQAIGWSPITKDFIDEPPARSRINVPPNLLK